MKFLWTVQIQRMNNVQGSKTLSNSNDTVTRNLCEIMDLPRTVQILMLSPFTIDRTMKEFGAINYLVKNIVM